jgi:hypothetical protein
MSQSNEGRCCDAVLTVIEGELHTSREILSKDTPASRGVEVRCRVGDAVYALEHTLIDPYPNKRDDDQQFLGVMGELERSLPGQGVLRADCTYEAWVDIHAFRGRKRPEIPAVRDAIKSWIIATAPKLDPQRTYETLELDGSAPSVPVRVLLKCTLWPGRGDSLRIGRLVRPTLPEQRRDRIRTALEKKGPKLLAERRGGVRTVLILENDDGALSNPVEIGAALHAELAASAFAIDDVYLVDTDRPDGWLIWRMKHGTRSWPQRFESPPSWEFSPETLQDILAG